MKVKNRLYIYGSFLLITILTLLFFSDDSSLLTGNYYGSDSSLFMLFGRGIKDGLTIYKDLFDHKGPYLFFIEFISQVICEGKTGVFIIQVINLFLCMLIIDKIYLINNDEESLVKRLAFQIPFVWTFIATLDAGNTNEEFCLTFLLLSLYWTLKYIKRTKEGDYKHNPLIAFVYGIFFGIIALIRINNSAFMCAAILFIVIVLIYRKEYTNLFKNAYMFIIGVIISIIPIFVYFYFKDALIDMLYSTFVFAFRYSTEESTLFERFVDYFSSINIVFFISSLIPLFILITAEKTKELDMLFVSISSLSTFVTTFIGLGFLHYFQLTIPSIVYGTYLFYDNYDKCKYYFKNKIVIIVLIVLMLGELYNVGMNFAKPVIHIIDYNLTYHMKDYYDYYTDQSIDIVNHIPVNERNSVWGYGIHSKFYMRTGIYPALKYYDYLDLYFKMKTCDIKESLINSLNNKEVKWIIISKKEVDIPIEIDYIIYNEYIQKYDNNEFVLYHIN